ncbi:MAG: hypothetical protein ACXWIS_08225, partial [Burkholderiales bacterium]
LKEAGQENLAFKFLNRSGIESYTTGGVYAVDQWRRIGVKATHEQLETKLYLAAQQKDNPTFDAALDFNCDYMDEPNLQLIKYLSPARSSLNYTGFSDAKVDEMYDQQSAEFDAKKRAEIVREIERQVLNDAYTVPTIWWHRTIVTDRRLKGWKITPSHYLNQDLSTVWLDQ